MKYRTVDGDVLDQICLKHYGSDNPMTETVLVCNPGLAQHGPIFREGIIIELPSLDQIEGASNKVTIRDTIRLWD